MNERLTELYRASKPKEALASQDEFKSANSLLGSDVEKFAEMIVKECIGCCEQVIGDPVPKTIDTFEQGGIHCIDEIRQHFGIGMSTEDKKTLIKELLGVKND